jgi:glycine oxidase
VKHGKEAITHAGARVARKLFLKNPCTRTAKRPATMPASFIFYNARVKTWDAIIIGGGIIGLTLAIGLRKRGFSILIIERGELGHEASYAAAGMLADCPSELPQSLWQLAAASAKMYPEFVHELEDESGIKMDLRDNGTVLLSRHALPEDNLQKDNLRALTSSELAALEPEIKHEGPAFFRAERSLDPRSLTKAAIAAIKHREVDVVSGTTVQQVLISSQKVTGVLTEKREYSSAIVINCAGAWAGEIFPRQFTTKPVKGQMLALLGTSLQHVVRAPGVYFVPRSDGRLVVGSTLEDAGFDKRVETDVIQRLHQAAIDLVPALQSARLHEAWAGLRPGTQDEQPILGETATQGYFAATGHYRDGILLAPITAKLMAQVILGEKPEFDLSAFSVLRFEPSHRAVG